jgi:hypothetical protein
MKIIRELLYDLLMLALLGVGLLMGLVLYRAAQTVRAMQDLPVLATDAIHVEGNATRRLVADQLTRLRGDVFRRIDSVQVDLIGQVGNAISVANTAELDANARLTEAIDQTQKLGPLADKLGGLADQLSATAKPVGHVADQIDAALPDFLDCAVTEDGIGNPTCLYRRYADVTADFDHMVQVAATATPRIVQSADAMTAAWAGISEALQKWVDRLTAPPTVKDEIKAWISVVITGLSHAL